MAKTDTSKKENIGKLKSFGLSKLWQTALLLPSSWDDLTNVVSDFSQRIDQGTWHVFVGKLDGTPEIKFEPGKAPRMVGYLADPFGVKVGFSVFGDSRDLMLELQERRQKVYILARVKMYNDRYWLDSPEVVPEEWIGRLRPRYPGKPKVITPETVRARVLGLLETTIPIAADFLAEELKDFGPREKLPQLAGLSRWTLEQIISQAHTPKTLEHGKHAQRAMEHLASLGIIKGAKGNNGSKPAPIPKIGDWRKRVSKIPFALTDEQEAGIKDSLADITSGTLMHRVISGDVGTGKTAVYGPVAASVVDGGGKAVVLLPNEGLASQVAKEFKSWWPDIPIQLVTGDSKDKKITAPLAVGTTALLFRELDHPTLLIVDEQQKYSREQREQLAGVGTHFLEVTATCIPRSQALIRYGVVKVSKLTKNHTPKTIHTKIWWQEDKQELAKSVRETLRNGDQVLYVYPLREPGEKPEGDDEEFELVAENAEKPSSTDGRKLELTSATEIYEQWNKIYPGRVRCIHSRLSGEEKTKVLEDMTEGRASVLIATTAVEVGISIPKLRQVIIVHPERHGLTTLHQIRGRVARKGGVGRCDLYMPYPACSLKKGIIKEATMERLSVLEKTQDGFKVAEYDMRLRGVGDMSKGSSKQSGADETFLFGRPVSIDILDAVMKKLSEKK